MLEMTERLRGEGEAYAVATVVRSVNLTSAKPGAKAIISRDGEIAGWIGGGCAQPAVRKAARAALGDGRPRLIRIKPGEDEAAEVGIEEYEAHCHSGGTLDIFIEPVLPAPTLVVIGASPVGQALAKLARQVGFSVMAAVRAGDAALYADADEVVEGFDLPPVPEGLRRFVVVATQGRGDREGLTAALDAGADWIAFIASHRKGRALKEELIADGADADAVERVQAPAGLDIGALTPEEIAVSILAEIVRDHRARTLPVD